MAYLLFYPTGNNTDYLINALGYKTKTDEKLASIIPLIPTRIYMTDGDIVDLHLPKEDYTLISDPESNILVTKKDNLLVAVDSFSEYSRQTLTITDEYSEIAIPIFTIPSNTSALLRYGSFMITEYQQDIQKITVDGNLLFPSEQIIPNITYSNGEIRILESGTYNIVITIDGRDFNSLISVIPKVTE